MFAKLTAMPSNVKQYLVITLNYWLFTLTDGALRMLVVLYFHQLGYSPLAIASLFLFYEFFGVVTNLLGGWLGAKIGLNKTMQLGLALQVVALLMLSVSTEYLTVVWVMIAQAISGIAKDLNKMSAKSSIKMLVPKEQSSKLFQWVALLTGSKNALKGIGFFLGGVLLAILGFQASVVFMAGALAVTVIISHFLLTTDLGKAQAKPKFSELFSKSAALNYLSGARLFLFAARDVWFVVALPVFLISDGQWSHQQVGSFMALWVIGYGIVQSLTPKFIALRERGNSQLAFNLLASKWAWLLSICCLLIYLCLVILAKDTHLVISAIVIGLLCFGALFAINSAIHSFMIVDIAKEDGVSLDVGFYYMANAAGRLFGTVASGVIFQFYGLAACLLMSFCFIVLAAVLVKQSDCVTKIAR